MLTLIDNLERFLCIYFIIFFSVSASNDISQIIRHNRFLSVPFVNLKGQILYVFKALARRAETTVGRLNYSNVLH